MKNESTPRGDCFSCKFCQELNKEYYCHRTTAHEKVDADYYCEDFVSNSQQHNVIDSTPSEGLAERFDKKFIYDSFDNTGLWILECRKHNAPASDWEVKEFLLEEIATAKHQERQEIIKKIFEKVVLSEDQARVIRELEREK